MAGVTFELGQAVRWPAARGGVAQVIELRRSRVRIFYPTKRGTSRMPIVAPAELARLQQREPVLPARNLFNRAILKPQRKTYHLEAGSLDLAGAAAS